MKRNNNKMQMSLRRNYTGLVTLASLTILLGGGTMIGNANMPGNATTVLAAHNVDETYHYIRLYPTKDCSMTCVDGLNNVSNCRISFDSAEGHSPYDYAAVFARYDDGSQGLEFRKVIDGKVTLRTDDNYCDVMPAKALPARQGYKDYDFYQVNLGTAGAGEYMVNKHTGRSESVLNSIDINARPDWGKGNGLDKIREVRFKIEDIPAKMTYEAADNLKFGESSIATPMQPGKKKITYINITTLDESRGKSYSEILSEPQNGVTRVGNRQVTVNSDGSKTITTYNVDPKTGDLDLQHPVIANVPAPLINVKPKFSNSTEPVVINDSSISETTSADTTPSQAKVSDAVESAVLPKTQSQAKPQTLSKTQQSDQHTRKLPQMGVATSLLAGCMSLISALGLAIRKRK